MTLADRLREEGFQKGRELAMQETMTLADKFKKEALYQTAINLLNLGQELPLISKATGLSIEKIKELQDKE